MTNDNLDQNDPNRLVCFCKFVTLGEIKRAVAAGAKGIEDIREITSASTGCGVCVFEIEEILRDGIKALADVASRRKGPRVIGTGRFQSGIPDLGSNKKHLKGLGKK